MTYYRFITNPLSHSTKGRTKKPFRMVSNVLPLKSPLPYLPNDSGLAVLKTCLERGRKSCWIFFCFCNCVLYVFVLPRNVTSQLCHLERKNFEEILKSKDLGKFLKLSAFLCWIVMYGNVLQNKKQNFHSYSQGKDEGDCDCPSYPYPETRTFYTLKTLGDTPNPI